MNSECAYQALSEAAVNTLETMFFCEIGPADDAGAGAPAQAIDAQVEFEGTRKGRLALRIGLSAARTMTADFLAAEESEVSDEHSREVVCELANMICGSALSRIEHNGSFRLHPPRAAASFPAAPGVTRFAGRIYNGVIEAVLELDDPACQAQRSAS